MKGKLMILLIMVLIVLPLASASAADKVFKWRLFHTAPGPTNWDAGQLGPMFKEIEVLTGGRLKVEVFFKGQHPFKPGDQLKVVKERYAEMVVASGAHVSGAEPRLSVLDQVMLLPGGDFSLYKEVFNDFRKDYFKDIWAKYNAQEFISCIWGAQQIYTTPKVPWIENWDSLKGSRIRTYTPEMANLIKALGGIPVAMAFPEVPTALQTGLIDGHVTSFLSTYNLGLFEVEKKVNMITMMYVTAPYLINKNAWSELPSDIQATFTKYMESKREWFSEGMVKADGLALQRAFVTHNIEVRGLPAGFRDEIRNRCYEIAWKPWIERVGKGGAEAFNEVAKLLIKKGYTVPGYTPH